VLYFYLKGSPGNNFRRARKHHKLGEEYHLKGNDEKAKYHYMLSNEYRERAMKQEKS